MLMETQADERGFHHLVYQLFELVDRGFGSSMFLHQLLGGHDFGQPLAAAKVDCAGGLFRGRASAQIRPRMRPPTRKDR